MEQRHKQINDLITRIALGNPDITNDQVIRARSMYNGDIRPIEEIEAELLAYSQQISANKKKSMMIMRSEKIEKADIPFVHIAAETSQELLPQGETKSEKRSVFEEDSESIIIPGIADMSKGPQEELSLEPVDEMARMLSEYQATQPKNNDKMIEQPQPKKATAKQLVKKQETPSVATGSNEGGYGNVLTLLAITMILSILTILIGFFTIIAS